MSKKISEIYTEYKIMPNLQMHMLRVAAVAAMICDNFNEPLPKEDIVTACLLHDMGNIIKSKLEYFPEFNKPEGIEYWQKVKDEYIKKYGANEEEAHEKIMRELGISENVIKITNHINFSQACHHRDNNNFVIKIINYADWRVSPFGIVSYEERMQEAQGRYKHDDTLKRNILIECGKDVEKQIFSKCNIKPENINDQTAESVISGLKNFVVK